MFGGELVEPLKLTASRQGVKHAASPSGSRTTMLCPPHPPAPIVTKWLERHSDPRNLLLHLVGIPATIMGVLLFPVYAFLLSLPILVLGVSLFVGGYVLQFLGHAIDRTEPGEWKAIRKWLRRKYGLFLPAGEVQKQPAA
jgi:predicted membrane channel-forming protein YqfA (hemolysin III family)